MKEFDRNVLAEFDGSDGKPVYIAFDRKVYDISKSRLWKGGSHMKRHHAGEDLTEDIELAPHGAEMLRRFPQVGVLKQETDSPPQGDVTADKRPSNRT
jgi:predicted heme/steroid binding protein